MANSLRTGVLCIALAASAVFAGQAAQPRAADDILKDMTELKQPVPDREKLQARDPEYIKQIQGEMKEYQDKRMGLVKELFDADPENAKLPPLLETRWRSPAFAAEAQGVVAAGKPASLVPVAEAALVMQKFSGIRSGQSTYDEAKAAAEAFAVKYPTDSRAEQLAYSVYSMAPADQKVAAGEAFLAKYPNAKQAGYLKGAKRQVEMMGKPFELTFTDAVSGKEVTMASLKGKVVVLDFWATWCGPCVADMPHMKEIYAKFKDQGVEFIGVSLDQPEETGKGLTKLKEFVATNDIKWPQYYQGNYWDSAFSKNWGINSIPALFVVDTDGNLASTSGRGKLDTLIPELLAKGKKQ